MTSFPECCYVNLRVIIDVYKYTKMYYDQFSRILLCEPLCENQTPQDTAFLVQYNEIIKPQKKHFVFVQRCLQSSDGSSIFIFSVDSNVFWRIWWMLLCCQWIYEILALSKSGPARCQQWKCTQEDFDLKFNLKTNFLDIFFLWKLGQRFVFKSEYKYIFGW